jgi:hypothetical protein
MHTGVSAKRSGPRSVSGGGSEADGDTMRILTTDDTAYTVGLAPAELVVIGPPLVACMALIERAVARGLPLEPDLLVSGLWPGFDVAVVLVGARHLPEVAPALSQEARVLQLVVPDPAGRFPWDPGCDVRIRLRQPVLESKERRCRWSCG